jgi:aspartyl-tRNA(Asn)/glutamyl-tRNA(Gln) amidotransferase subunit A
MIDWSALEIANAPLNAFVDFDRSAMGGNGPLAGVTIGVKANIAVKGLPWTGGCELFRNRIAQSDAQVVAKLRTAGAAIIGSLNMDEAALGAKTDNPWFRWQRSGGCSGSVRCSVGKRYHGFDPHPCKLLWGLRFQARL